MKKFLFAFLILALLLPTLMVAQESAVVDRLVEYGANLPQGYAMIEVADFQALLAEKEVTLIDVREVAEYEGGHIEGAFNVPIRTLGQNLALLPDLDAPIVVLCKVGGRAIMAGAALQYLGYTDVKIVKGGTDAWVAAGGPVVTEATVVEPTAAPDIDPALVAAVDTFLSTLPDGFGMISPADVSVALAESEPVVIDVRSLDEWNTGYIEGAQHIWINEFAARVDELPADKDTPIIVYCGVGTRGGYAKMMLGVLGYTNVSNMSGGLTAWKAAELPLVGVPEEAAPELDLNAVLAGYVASLPETFGAVRPADLAAELATENKPFLVDTRTPDEYAEGFIEGAINIPINELTQNLDLLPAQDANIVVVCGSGHRSALAMTALNLLGYTNTRSMLGGMGSWIAAELPTTTTPPEVVRGTAPELDPALFAQVDAFVTAIPAGFYTVKAADLNTELVENPPVLIDLRTDSEWESGHIEGATHIPLRDFFADPALLPAPDANIVLYDNPIHRSSMALTFLRLMGYENVRALGGGVGAWQKAELPLVTE